MVTKTSVVIYSIGSQATLACDFSLNTRTNANLLVFSVGDMSLAICLRDIVDIEELYNLLKNKEKKIILHCTLKYQGKEYQGLRKVIRKNNNIVVSLGGYRLELNGTTKELMAKTIESVKSKL
jgi:hypothetical protein